MKKKIIYMFSGQGSQYYQMGKELYENQPTFRFWMDQCNEIVHPLIQASLVDILYRKREKYEPFDRILYSNPALLSVEYSLSRLLPEMGMRADLLLGYSLGEITAAVVSGALPLEEGMELVVGLARLVEKKTPQTEMLAIIHSQSIWGESPDIFQNCRFTAANFPGSFVVSGLPDDIDRLQEELKRREIPHQKLPVKYGFHTGWIDPIEEEYRQLARKMRFASPGIPVISSAKNEFAGSLTDAYLWEVIRAPVDFSKTVEWALRQGDSIYIDAGPSGTLATFVKYILPSKSGSRSLQTMNQFGRDLLSLEKLRTGISECMVS